MTTRTSPASWSPRLDTAAAGGFDRIVAVFQPHRYSRTATLWQSYADAFERADVVVLTDVYAAGEAPRPGVSGELLVHAVLDAHPRTRVVYLPRRGDLVAFLDRELRPGDLCLTLGRRGHHHAEHRSGHHLGGDPRSFGLER